MVNGYYKRLYPMEDIRASKSEEWKFSELSRTDLCLLHRYVSALEVKNAIFQMGPMKAAGSGWNITSILPEFLENFWRICYIFCSNGL